MEQSVAESSKHTLITAGSVLTEPKTALTGGVLENFSARPEASMAAFNAETVPSRLLGL